VSRLAKLADQITLRTETHRETPISVKHRDPCPGIEDINRSIRAHVNAHRDCGSLLFTPVDGPQTPVITIQDPNGLLLLLQDIHPSRRPDGYVDRLFQWIISLPRENALELAVRPRHMKPVVVLIGDKKVPLVVKLSRTGIVEL